MSRWDIVATKLWNDNHDTFVWVLTLGNHSTTCGELSGSDYQECIKELLEANGN